VRLVATGFDQPKGITCADYTAREGLLGTNLFVAVSGSDEIVEVTPDGQRLAHFAGPMNSFPVGLAAYGSSFAQDLYVGNAYGGGVSRLDALGDDFTFALRGKSVAGMDFGYGGDLFVGEWTTGNIWRVDPQGNVILFATIPGEARYLSFGPLNHPSEGVRQRLFVTEYGSGSIYRVDPDGTVSLFAQTRAQCLEGLAFGPGGAFGYDLYAGDLCSGTIYRVDAFGNVSVWSSGLLPGAADICFMAAGTDAYTMYVVDGKSEGSLWAIRPK
jgi:sugar lactone lactonase YvrE